MEFGGLNGTLLASAMGGNFFSATLLAEYASTILP